MSTITLHLIALTGTALTGLVLYGWWRVCLSDEGQRESFESDADEASETEAEREMAVVV